MDTFHTTSSLVDGILLIDKPSGWTSFDVVAKVRGILKYSGVTKPKVGHTGTLDPLATGLLVLVIGSYCKRAEEFSKLDKTYEVTMRLGVTSTTGDEEGVKTETKKLRAVSNEELQEILEQFTGVIMQTPPAYSAIKVNGQRAYKLARAGQTVKLDPRQVHIYSNILKNIRMPEVFFETKVSSGTYVRSLVEDIGKELGTGAYMSDLRRTTVGKWDIKNALSMTDISATIIAEDLITL